MTMPMTPIIKPVSIPIRTRFRNVKIFDLRGVVFFTENDFQDVGGGVVVGGYIWVGGGVVGVVGAVVVGIVVVVVVGVGVVVGGVVVVAIAVVVVVVVGTVVVRVGFVHEFV